MFIIAIMVVLSGCNKDNNNPNNTKGPDIESCPNCVYSFYIEKKYLKDTPDMSDKERSLISFTRDYTTLKDNENQRSIFLGHILDNYNKIERAFTCLTNDKETFCLEGALESDSRKEEVYEKNKELLKNSETYKDTKNKKGKTVKKCYDLKTSYLCKGDIEVYLTNKGYVSLKDKNNMCYIDSNGTIVCKKN